MIKTKSNSWWVTPVISVLIVLSLLYGIPAALGVQRAYYRSDWFLFVLLLLLMVAISYIRNTPHLLSNWRQVFQSKIAMGAAVILGVYLLITLLDCLHFQRRDQNPEIKPTATKVIFSNKIESVLDLLLSRMHERDEKSYSAPFATRLFVKQTTAVGDVGSVRDFPRLKYGGKHLESEADKIKDIIFKVITGLVLGLAMASGLLAIAMLYDYFIHCGGNAVLCKKGWQQLSMGKTSLPWRVIIGVLGAIVVVITLLVYLSGYYHVLGTDKVGHDTLYQSFKSIRTGVLIGTLTTLVMLPFAVFLGIAAGYFKGWIDDVIQFIYTTLHSIPGVLLIVASVLAIDMYIENHQALFRLSEERGDIKLLALCAILGVTSWTGLCRLLRGEALKIREVDYIQAAHAFGVSHGKVITRHILPNVMHIVMIVVVLDFSSLVLAEAVLSYIGIGVDPSMHSWGNMINSARLEMARDPMVWWSLVAAFIFMFVLVLAANLFSDAVRDAFDPKLVKRQ